MEAWKQECWVKSCIRNFRALTLSCPLGGDERWEKEPNWSPNVLSSGLFWYRVILGRKRVRPSLKEGEESQQTALGILHWTHWQNDLSFYKEVLGYFGNSQGATGIWTVGSGKNTTSHLQLSSLSGLGLCNICCCWWKFDLQSPLSSLVPTLDSRVQGCYSYLRNPKGMYMFTHDGLIRPTEMSSVFTLDWNYLHSR